MSTITQIAEFLTKYKETITLITAVGGFMGVLNSLYRGRKLRIDELRWKRASESKDVVDMVHKHEKARAALTILDLVDINLQGYHQEIVVTNLGEKPVKMTYDQVLTALSKNLKDADDDDKTLIEYFDWLFYFVDRVEQNIKNKLFDFEDVKYIFLPYFIKITEDERTRKTYFPFMKVRMYYLAAAFWKRYITDKDIRKIVTLNETNYAFPTEDLFSAAVPSDFYRSSTQRRLKKIRKVLADTER